MKTSHLTRPLAASLLACTAMAANADFHYNVTQIGGVPGADHSYVAAINNSNTVVGTSYAPGTSHAFRWSEEYGVWDFHLNWTESSAAYDINDTGVIVGTMRMNGEDVGFTTHNGGWWYNDPIQGSTGAVTHGINNLHQSVGGSGWAEDVRATGWLLGSPGFNLANYGPQEPSLAFRLDDSGDSVGWARLAGTIRASIFRNNNTVFDLHGLLPVGTVSSIALDINNLGWVTGHFQDNQGHQKGFVFNEELGMQMIDDADFGLSLRALNINGMAVGGTNNGRAAIWDSNMGVVDLNTLIDPNSGWILTDAKDVNDNGWITGHGFYNGVYTTFVANPEAVPEPASMTILALGIGALAARTRLKKQAS